MKLFTILFTIITLSSCAELMNIADSASTSAPLSKTEIADGLKEALYLGTDSASTQLGHLNGYYGDPLVKILLPKEADIIVENANKIPGGDKVIEDVVIHINRAAESAAKEATPIFEQAIKNMSIPDALSILNGNDDAATQYLKQTTYTQLFDLYQPIIQKSLDKEIAAGISPNMSWDLLTDKWNMIADNPFGKMAGLHAVNIDLDKYLTEQALNGLFIKIAQEESLIRKDPMARVNDILKRVFGS
ncbi:DUF4197 domain-containing protein [Carboxylicivirga sp. M1479]|uniref:DUF4197 domain-containing protein n=1 Tax=Carboxylicivirga sp. M1479 TaxID=2594476 RepID=UPI0011789FC5|nr:DUF4197 domain-containing protein [Carboxylicivirga sp. M1479]TRX62241.1 DUF4197 domain-containing protein [Carboxylicivirga sp. M1479]